MPRRRLTLPVALLAVAVAGPLAGLPAPAGAATKTCKAGQAKLTLVRSTTCVTPARLLPAATPGAKSGAHWIRFAADRPAAAALQRKLAPRRWRTKAPAPKVATAVKRLRAQSDRLAASVEGRATAQRAAAIARFAPRAITLSEGPVSVNQTAGGVSAQGSITATDSATGTSATLDLGAKATVDGALDLEIGFTVRDKDKGSSSSTSFAAPIIRKDEIEEVCPSAVGVIRRRSKFDGRRTTREKRTLVGLDYRNETMTWSSTVNMTGQVDRGAVLRTITYDVTYKFGWAFAASALRGIGRGNVQLDLTATARGTIDGATGARTGGETTITGRLRDLDLNAKQERAALAKLLADRTTRDKIIKAVSDLIDTDRQALKDAETGWQKPNACATMTLDPPSGQLEEDATAPVKGTVKAKDGTQADGDWTLAARARGQAATLPGTSSASAPIDLTMTGEAPDAAGRTVDVRLRATSPAGVAEAPWTADSVRQELYFRVVGGSGAQTAGGSRTNSNCVTDQTAPVGPWNYAFQQTTGEPDGQVSIDERGANGNVRGSGDSTRPAFTWRKTCSPDPPQTQPVASVTFSGQFGPTISFDAVSGDPSRVDVTWGSMSPPAIFGFDVDDVDCRPVPGDPVFTTQRISVATLRQSTPFTLSADIDWNVEANRAGATSCIGDTQQSLTLQRVKADGSPL